MRGAPARDQGASMLEVLLVMGLLTSMTTTAVPKAEEAIASLRGRQAASYVASRLREAQVYAVRTNRTAGLVFDLIGTTWRFRFCVDGNANGLRRADIATAIDPCLDGGVDIAARYPGVEVAVDPALRGPEGESGSADPVRFGASDIASFSPVGTGSSGSLFLRLANGQHLLVRVTGVTGRTRTLRFLPQPNEWQPL